MESLPPVIRKEQRSPRKEAPEPSPSPPVPPPPASPPPDCAICLGQCKKKSFTDSCLHQFCFHCLLTWSKIKAECPLCKQAFKSIIHNVKSNEEYEEYTVEQPQVPHPSVDEFLGVDYFDTRRFRYRTTLTLHRQEGLALERLLFRYPLVPLGALPSSLPQPPPARHTRRPRPGLFRQAVYRNNLWARPLPDITGRHRECSPEFYRNNPAQIHRLVPWLDRELAFLTPECSRLLSRIVDCLITTPIQSQAFRLMMLPYLNVYTDHFVHEFYSFARSPFDMVGYDCSVQYDSGSHPPILENLVLSSSDGENSADSDIIMFPEAGPSYAFPVPFDEDSANQAPSSSRLGTLSNSVIAIETMSHSETDDSSDEVVMVRYIKPPQERTPEVVDLLASDSDTVIIEEPRQMNSPIEVVDELSQPTPLSSGNVSSSSQRPNDQPSSSGLVKVSLKRNHTLPSVGADTESEGDWTPTFKKYKRSKRPFRKHRPVSRDSASTECTDRDTDCTETDYCPNYNSDSSNSLPSLSSATEKRENYKSKQFLASNILKKFKMNSAGNCDNSSSVSVQNNLDSDRSYHQSEYEQNSSDSDSNSSKKKSQKKSKYKKRSTVDMGSNCKSKKLKFKSRSKSKERLIMKIFENKQTKSAKGKTSMSSKSKAKNKCFVKPKKNVAFDANVPSTSKGGLTPQSSESETEAQRNDGHSTSATSSGSSSRAVSSSTSSRTPVDSATNHSNNLLDIVSRSILSHNNAVRSINNDNTDIGFTHDNFPDDMFTSLMNKYGDDFFDCANSVKPLNLSAHHETDDSSE